MRPFSRLRPLAAGILVGMAAFLCLALSSPVTHVIVDNLSSINISNATQSLKDRTNVFYLMIDSRGYITVNIAGQTNYFVPVIARGDGSTNNPVPVNIVNPELAQIEITNITRIGGSSISQTGGVLTVYDLSPKGTVEATITNTDLSIRDKTNANYAAVDNEGSMMVQLKDKSITNVVRVGLEPFVSDPIPLLVDTDAAYSPGDYWAEPITITNVFSGTNNNKGVITGFKLEIEQDSTPEIALIPMFRGYTSGSVNSPSALTTNELKYAAQAWRVGTNDTVIDLGTNRLITKTGFVGQFTSTNRNLVICSIAQDTTRMSNRLSTITIFGYIDKNEP